VYEQCLKQHSPEECQKAMTDCENRAQARNRECTSRAEMLCAKLEKEIRDLEVQLWGAKGELARALSEMNWARVDLDAIYSALPGTIKECLSTAQSEADLANAGPEKCTMWISDKPFKQTSGTVSNPSALLSIVTCSLCH